MAARPFRLRAPHPSEHQIQAAVVEWSALACRVYPALRLLYAIPNGTKLAGTPRERAIQAAKLKAEGLRPGFPDMGLPVRRRNYNALFIEHKSDTGRVEPDQRWWLCALSAAGNAVAVSRSFDATRRLLIDYVEDTFPEDAYSASEFKLVVTGSPLEAAAIT